MPCLCKSAVCVCVCVQGMGVLSVFCTAAVCEGGEKKKGGTYHPKLKVKVER